MTHELKCWPPYFAAIRAGEKPFELRKDDRNYQPGDTLILHEWDPETESYTGYNLNRVVGLVLRDAVPFGLREGYCILGLPYFISQ